MNKSDYDKYYKKGGTYVIPVELFNELFDELERLSFNYEQALEDLDKKDNIINELEEYIKPYLYMLNGISDKDEYEQAQLDTFTDIMDKLQELKGSDKD